MLDERKGLVNDIRSMGEPETMALPLPHTVKISEGATQLNRNVGESFMPALDLTAFSVDAQEKRTSELIDKLELWGCLDEFTKGLGTLEEPLPKTHGVLEEEWKAHIQAYRQFTAQLERRLVDPPAYDNTPELMAAMELFAARAKGLGYRKPDPRRIERLMKMIQDVPKDVPSDYDTL